MNVEQELIATAEKTHQLEKMQIAALLESASAQTALSEAADRVRKRFVGEEVHLRGLIEFSNICKQNCLYCGLRRENKKIERYRLEKEQIVELAQKAKSYGYQTVVLQSGEDAYFTVARLTEILQEIKSFDLAITLSIGERTREEYAALKKAGADRFLLRIETTDRNLYHRLHPGMDFKQRLRCLRDLREAGYEVGTGCLVGLPGQTVESLAEDLLFFQKIDADMVGIGPFIPNPDTPLSSEHGGSVAVSLRFISLLRLLLPGSNIPATTAMETLEPNARIIALKSGANVVMPNVTEGEYRRKYALYPGKVCVLDAPEDCMERMRGKILAMGRKIAAGYGDRNRKT